MCDGELYKGLSRCFVRRSGFLSLGCFIIVKKFRGLATNLCRDVGAE